MIKSINKSELLTTTFIAEKTWELFNIENDSEIMEETSSMLPTGTSIALDFVEYRISENPILNRNCNISPEQQNQNDAIYEEGISGSGIFDPYGDIQNSTGTYKRLLYTQIKKAFYNQYHNPINIFGMENIDFHLSKTNRFLADNFRIFTIPRKMFGDKISEGSIKFYDNSLDDNVEINDDKFGNLIASSNLFSKVQEIRHFGNLVVSGSSSYDCPTYSGSLPLGIPTIAVIQQ